MSMDGEPSAVDSPRNPANPGERRSPPPPPFCRRGDGANGSSIGRPPCLSRVDEVVCALIFFVCDDDDDDAGGVNAALLQLELPAAQQAPMAIALRSLDTTIVAIINCHTNYYLENYF